MPRVAISTSASGDTTLIAAATNIRYRVRRLVLVAAAAVSAKFKSGANDLCGAMALAANGQVVLDEPYNGIEPWFTTNTNEAFIINLSGAVAVAGWIIYDTQPQS